MIAALSVAGLLLAGAARTVPVSTVIGLPLPSRANQLGWSALEGPLFAKTGPSANDVFQGELDDCALVARMASLAEQHPAQLQHAMVELADGNVQVTLQPAHQAEVRVIVDRLVPTRAGVPVYTAPEPADFVPHGARVAASSNQRPIWPALLEKALAVFHGGYGAIDGDHFEQPAELDGSDEFTVWLPGVSPALAAAALREALSQGNSVVLGNADPALAAEAALKPAHAYAVLALREDEGKTMLLLRNPTGEASARSKGGRAGHRGEFYFGLEEALRTFRFLGLSGHQLQAVRSLAPLQQAIDAAKAHH